MRSRDGARGRYCFLTYVREECCSEKENKGSGESEKGDTGRAK